MDNNNGSIEENSKNTQRSYLMEQFESILDKIGEGYGQPLQDELIRRMEKTIEEFHNDIAELIGNIKDQREKRQDTLKHMLDGDEGELNVSANATKDDDTNETAEMSDYERRIEEKGANKEQSEVKGDKTKKRGIFRRKKK